MKAYELQIGDWVTYDGIPSQVIMVSAEGVAMIVKEEQIVYLNSERLNPIPLTDEILIANGWSQTSWVAGLFFAPRKGFERDNLTIRKTDDGYEFTAFCHETALKYVHQFQQILRLCGYESMTQGLGIVSQ